MRLLRLSHDRIRDLDGSGSDIARVEARSMVAMRDDRVSNLAGGEQAVVCWTGSYAEIVGGDLFEAHPSTWGQQGWDALVHASRAALARSSTPIWIRPHARHIVSDVPGIRRFASTIAMERAGHFSLLLDPVSMLDASHVLRGDANDAVRRVLEEALTLGMPIAAVVAMDASLIDDRVRGDGFAKAGGAIDPSLFVDFAKATKTPIVLISPAGSQRHRFE